MRKGETEQNQNSSTKLMKLSVTRIQVALYAEEP